MFLAIISLLIYIVQICIAVMIASVIPIFAFKKWRRKKVFMLLLLLCLSIELLGIAHLANNPFFWYAKKNTANLSRKKINKISLHLIRVFTANKFRSYQFASWLSTLMIFQLSSKPIIWYLDTLKCLSVMMVLPICVLYFNRNSVFNY